MLTKRTQKSVFLLLTILASALFVIFSHNLALAAGYVIGDTNRCVDGTPVAYLQGVSAADYCASHGGYDPSGTFHCVDGTAFAGGQGFDPTSFCASHGGYAPVVLTAPTPTTTTPPTTTTANNYDIKTNAFGDCDGASGENCIIKDVNLAVDFLSAGVGVVATIMIIVGGIQYSVAGDNPQAVQAAKARIRNAIIALLAFAFLWAFLQWLVPGGVF